MSTPTLPTVKYVKEGGEYAQVENIVNAKIT